MDLASVKRKTKEMRMATATLPQELVVEIVSWIPAEYLWPLSDVSWRTVGEDIPFDRFSMYAPAPVVNGAVHWFGMKTVSSSFRTIVGFDLKDESFQEIPTPNSDDNSSIQLITEIGGQLCVFCAHVLGLVQIWALKEYGLVSSWTKLYNFGLGPYFFHISPVGVVTHNGDVIVRKDFNKLFLCHPKTNSISSLTSFCSDINDAHTYIGSIISPRLISGAGHIKTERILGR